MKKLSIIFLLITTIEIAFSACSSLTKCDNISQKELTVLVDISDKRLFTIIENDLNTNFPAFMQKTGLGSITSCQRLTLSIGHLSGKEDLELSSESISVSRKGQSNKEEKKQASPAPLVRLLQKKVNDYRLLTEDPVMTSGSNIGNVLLKAIIHSNADAETTILLFSDMVENNRTINLYKKIPAEKDIPAVIDQLIDPDILEKFKMLQESGVVTKIIIVMKEEPSGKINQRSIKNFWSMVFKELKLDVQFIDNLSNSIEI